MEAKYTPGPWHLERNKIRRRKYESGHSFTLCAYGPTMFGIARIEGPSNDTPEDIGMLHANARLIEAAPDLLEALVGLFANGAIQRGEGYMNRINAIAAARAAIAKAKGAA
jgi:hypothetical protein